MILTIIFFTLLFSFIFIAIAYITMLVFNFNFLSNVDTIMNYLLKAGVVIIILLFLIAMISIINDLINSNEIYDYGMRCIYEYGKNI